MGDEIVELVGIGVVDVEVLEFTFVSEELDKQLAGYGKRAVVEVDCADGHDVGTGDVKIQPVAVGVRGVDTRRIWVD